MGRRNWRRKQVTVHEVEEVTITRKKRKTYVLEDPPTIGEIDQNKTLKKQKPPLITNFDYGISRTKVAQDDDDSDYTGHGEIIFEEEKEQNKENEVGLNYKKVREFRCNSFTIRYVYCKTREAHFFNAVDVIQCIRESRPYSGVSRIIQPMLKGDLNRYLVASGKTKLYLSLHQLQEITEHYLTMTYRTKKDKIHKINKLRQQVLRIASKKKDNNATENADYPPNIEPEPQREVINIEDFSSDDEEQVEMAPTASGLFLIPDGLSKRFLIFKTNQVLEYIVYDGRTLFKSSDLFVFLFSKDANENTRDKLYSLFRGVAENVVFINSGEEVYFTTLQTLCILNHFLCQEIYQNLKSIFHRIMLLKINIVTHSEKAEAEVPYVNPFDL